MIKTRLQTFRFESRLPITPSIVRRGFHNLACLVVASFASHVYATPNCSSTLVTPANGIINSPITNNSAGACLDNVAVPIFSNSILENNASLTNTGSYTNQYGTINNRSTFINDAAATLHNQAYFENYGTPASVLRNEGLLVNSNQLHNAAGANITNTATGTIDNMSNMDTRGWIFNEGTFDNFGTVNNDRTIPGNVSTLSNKGVFNNKAGAVVTASNGAQVANLYGSTFVNDGTLAVKKAGEVNNDSTFRNNASGKIVNEGTFNQGLAELANAGEIRNKAQFNSSYGLLMNGATGKLINEIGAEINNGGNIYNQKTGAIVNDGLIKNTNAINLQDTSSFTNNGRIENSGGISFSQQGSLKNNGEIVNNGFMGASNFVFSAKLRNDGTITNESEDATLEIGSGIALTGTGDIILKGGKMNVRRTMEQSSVSIFDGTFTSDSKVTADVLLDGGTLSMVKGMSIDGDLHIDSGAAKLWVDQLFGSASLDKKPLVVTGTTYLTGGSLTVNLGYVDVGDNIPLLILSGNIIGSLDNIDLLLTIQQAYASYAFSLDAQGLWVTVDTLPAPEVPLPATVWLMGSGLLGLVGMARSRRRTV
jgi:hypothetical protein